MLSVLHVGLALCVTDDLCSSFGQDSSALLPLSKLCLQSLAGPFWWDQLPPALQVFPQKSMLL